MITWHLLIIAIAALAIIGGIAAAALLIALVVGKRKSGTGGGETEVIQDVHRGLEKMEERAQALESALLNDEESGDESPEEFSWSAAERKE